MVIRAVFSDLDGTLKSKKTTDKVPKSVRGKIKKLQEKGVKFGIATGKSLTRFHNYPIFNLINGPVILEAGCVIMRNKGAKYEIDEKWDKLIKRRRDVLEEVADSFDDRNVGWKTRTFSIEGGDEPEVPERYSNVVDFKENREYYDFFPKIAGKKKAIEYVCDREDIPLSQIAYIGDDLNDIEVLKKVGLPCAPVSAPKKIKEVVKQRGGIVARNEMYRGASQILSRILNSGR